MISITCEINDHIPLIYQVLTAAFGRTNEAELVNKIRNSPNFIPELSIVAIQDRNLVGHILFSPITIETNEQKSSALALAPLAVIPTHQNQGIGSQLVQTGLSMCCDLGHEIVIVLGHPQYYRRFGFQTASQFGISAPFSVPEEAFMVLELKPGALVNIKGTVSYPAYFNEV